MQLPPSITPPTVPSCVPHCCVYKYDVLKQFLIYLEELEIMSAGYLVALTSEMGLMMARELIEKGASSSRLTRSTKIQREDTL